MEALLRSFRAPFSRGVHAHLRATVYPSSPLACVFVIAAKLNPHFNQNEKNGIGFVAALAAIAIAGGHPGDVAQCNGSAASPSRAEDAANLLLLAQGRSKRKEVGGG